MPWICGFLTAFTVCMVLTSCGLMNVEHLRSAAPEVRDLPYQARDSDLLKKKILILPFMDSELQRSQNVTDIARRAVVEDLLSTNQFVVVSNADIGQDLRAFIKENREYDMVALSRLASSIGVAAVVEGRILEVRARKIGDEIGLFRKIRAQVDVAVQIRVYGAKSGTEIFSSVRRATLEHETTRVGENAFSDRDLQDDPNLIRAGVKKAFSESVVGVVRAVEKLSWEGRVALVSGEKIYVNAGRLSGIQVGDILRVSEEGSEVFDPESGKFIGLAPGRMKGTIEVVSYFGKDGAIAILHSGSGIKENDKVQLY
jgi:curli biogenesis system outer membrane secretion channel CsgG